jgi:WD40 repeat protein
MPQRIRVHLRLSAGLTEMELSFHCGVSVIQYCSYFMLRNPFSGLVLGMCLAFAGSSRADVVIEPLRKFGLGDLWQVAISPDRQWMATSGGGGAFLWNFTNGTVVHRLEAHQRRVVALAFSADSQMLLTGGGDAVVRAWDVNSGTEMRSFTGHLGEITGLTFAPNGQSFVSVGDNTARIWSFGTGELLHTFSVPGAGIFQARFAPDGNRLITADSSPANNVRVWNVATEQTILDFGGNRFIQRLEFFAGGNLVTVAGDTAVEVWDVETGGLIRPLDGVTSPIVGLLSSTNNSLVTAGCHNGQVITWDAATGDVQNNFFQDALNSLVAVPGTNQILAASSTLVRLRNNQNGDLLRVFAGHTTSTTTGVGFSPDGQHVVSGGGEVFTRLWNRTNAQPANMYPGHGAGTESVRFSPDGTRLLTTFGGPIHSARLLNVQTGQTDREFLGHTGWPLIAVFSPDGQRVATGAQDGTARLWDVATSMQIRLFNIPGTWVRAVAISSNGAFLATGSSDGIARLWNATNAQVLRTFELNAGSVISVAFSPANGDLLVAWEDGFLRTFDPATGELKLNSITPAAFLEAAEYSPDGRFILGGEGWPFFTARLWDAKTGAELRVFAGHAAPVGSVAFNATGTSILTGADIVRLWSIADIATGLEGVRKPNGLELRWHTGTLQQSTGVNGLWSDVTNAVSPWQVSTDQPSQYFRVKVPVE